MNTGHCALPKTQSSNSCFRKGFELSAIFRNFLEEPVTDDRLEQIEQALESIKQRNLRVEADKAWEVSAFRIVTICGITYLIAAVLLYVIGAERFWLGALVPTLGFFLSTQSLPAIKRWWVNSRYGINK